MTRSFRYCRPKTDPPETFLNYLVRRFPYCNAEQWQEHLTDGIAWLERKAQRRTARDNNNNNNNNKKRPAAVDEDTISQIETDTRRAEHSADAVVIVRDPSTVLLQGDVVMFNPPRSMEPDVDTEHIDVLHEDESMVVCVKNGNLPVSEGGRYSKNTLCYIMSQRMYAEVHPQEEEDTPPLPPGSKSSNNNVHHHHKKQMLFPVHRLDKETSGIVVLAKTSSAAAFLATQFHHHRSGEESEGTKDTDSQKQTTTAASCGMRLGDAMVTTTDNTPCDEKNHAEEACKEYEAIVVGVMDDAWLARLMKQQTTSHDAPEELSGYSAAAQGLPSLPRSDDINRLCRYFGVTVGCRLPLPPPSTHGDQPALMIPTPLDEEVSITNAIITVEARIGVEADDDPASIPSDHAQLSKLRMRCYGKDALSLGKRSITEVRVVAVDPILGWSRVWVRLYTGRTHQIRLHCAVLGFPVVGDKLYGTSQPAVVGFQTSANDAAYLARARGEVLMTYPLRSDEYVDGTATTVDDTSLMIVVHRHLLHARRLSITACPSKPAIGHEPLPQHERLQFTSDGMPWFTRDVVVMTNNEPSQGMDVLQGLHLS